VSDSHPGARSGASPWAIGLGAVGVVGIGVGTVFGILAHSKFEDSKGSCSAADENRCNADGVKLRDDSITFANVSTVGFIAGGAALIGAGVLLLTGNKPEATSSNHRERRLVGDGKAPPLTAEVEAGPTRGALVIRGAF
jgi:hypothetical protein